MKVSMRRTRFAIPVTPTGSIALSTSGFVTVVARGYDVTRNISLTRTDYTGTVTPTISGLPSGVTAAFSPTISVSGNTTWILTLTASAGATLVTTQEITVYANGSGVAEATTTFDLTVLAAGTYEWLRPRNPDGSLVNIATGMSFNNSTGEIDGETVHDQLQSYPNVIALSDTGNVTTNATNLHAALSTASVATSNTVITMPTGFEADGYFTPITNVNGYWCSLQWDNASTLPTPSNELPDLKGTYLNRVTPSDQANFPKIYNTATLGTAAASLDFLDCKKWQIRGIDFLNPLQDFKYWLVNVGYTDINDVSTYSEDIHFIQCACDGNWNSQRWIRFAALRVSCTDSYSDKCGTDGSDPQNLYYAFGPGPFKFHNNYLMCRGASENIFAGSGGPNGAAFSIQNGQITQNYCDKPVTVPASAKYIGDNAHKNGIELKSGDKIVIQGNRFGYHNGGGQQQTIVIKLSEQNGSNVHARTRDVIVMHNWQTRGIGGIVVTGIEFSPPGMLYGVSEIFVANNLGTPKSADGAQPFASMVTSTFNLSNVTFIFNTLSEEANRSYGGALGILNQAGVSTGIRVQYNTLLPCMLSGQEGPPMITSDPTPGYAGDAAFNFLFPDADSEFSDNLTFDAYTPANYPAQFVVSTIPDLGLHNYAADELWLDPSSPGYQAGPEGQDTSYQKALFDPIQARVLA